MRVLVTRPEPQAAATAARLAGLGHQAVVAPLLRLVPVAWEVPVPLPDVLVMTSANAARLGGASLAALAQLPLFAVGAATAAAARAAGFAHVVATDGDSGAVFGAVAAVGHASVLHLAGRDRSAAAVPPGLTVAVATVYAAEVVDRLPDAGFDVALLYSARTAAAFDALFAGERGGAAVAALSPAVAAAAGTGWARVAVAAAPTEDALFAAAGLLCDKPG